MMVEYESFSWKDEDGNQFTESANKETVIVSTPDGKVGCGWTAQQALANAHFIDEKETE